MRTLGKKILKTFKVSPEKFDRVFFELHDVFTNECGLVDLVEFFKKTLTKSSQEVTESTTKL